MSRFLGGLEMTNVVLAYFDCLVSLELEIYYLYVELAILEINGEIYGEKWNALILDLEQKLLEEDKNYQELLSFQLEELSSSVQDILSTLERVKKLGNLDEKDRVLETVFVRMQKKSNQYCSVMQETYKDSASSPLNNFSLPKSLEDRIKDNPDLKMDEDYMRAVSCFYEEAIEQVVSNDSLKIELIYQKYFHCFMEAIDLYGITHQFSFSLVENPPITNLQKLNYSSISFSNAMKTVTQLFSFSDNDICDGMFIQLFVFLQSSLLFLTKETLDDVQVELFRFSLHLDDDKKEILELIRGAVLKTPDIQKKQYEYSLKFKEDDC